MCDECRIYEQWLISYAEIHAEDPSLILSTRDGKLERGKLDKLLCIVYNSEMP